MTADAFIAWAQDSPEAERHELIAGMPVAMAPERFAHLRMKARVVRRVAEAIEAAGLPCEAFADGLAVAIDESTLYYPDATLRCGPPPAEGLARIDDPLVIVEVLSPPTRAVDTGVKLSDYFRLPSLRHYVLLRPETHTIIHHARDDDGTITTSILREGTLRLDPPGIELADLFA